MCQLHAAVFPGSGAGVGQGEQRCPDPGTGTQSGGLSPPGCQCLLSRGAREETITRWELEAATGAEAGKPDVAPQPLWGRGEVSVGTLPGRGLCLLPLRACGSLHSHGSLQTCLGLPSPRGALILTSPGASQARFGSTPRDWSEGHSAQVAQSQPGS